MTKTKIVLLVVVGLMIGAGCGLKTTSNTNANITINEAVAYDVTYPGQAGKTALELLQQLHQVESSAAGFVTAIDARSAVGNQFWSFYVNGKQADKGAGDYITSPSDQIGWKLESF